MAETELSRSGTPKAPRIFDELIPLVDCLWRAGAIPARHICSMTSRETYFNPQLYVLEPAILLKRADKLEIVSSFRLESEHLYGPVLFWFSERGGSPILGRESSTLPGARYLCLISFRRLRGDRA
jgi:hypothetical protein